MIIRLNGKNYDVEDGIRLSAFIEMQGLKPEGLAVAIDYNVVPKSQWRETILQENQELMLVHAVSGG